MFTRLIQWLFAYTPRQIEEANYRKQIDDDEVADWFAQWKNKKEKK